jgi:hypothetical protein
VKNVIVVTASRVTLSGLEIRGGSDYGVKWTWTMPELPPRGVTVRNCRIGGSGRDCIKTFNADALLIEAATSAHRDCATVPTPRALMSSARAASRCESCFIHDTATNGVYFKAARAMG